LENERRRKDKKLGFRELRGGQGVIGLTESAGESMGGLPQLKSFIEQRWTPRKKIEVGGTTCKGDRWKGVNL